MSVKEDPTLKRTSAELEAVFRESAGSLWRAVYAFTGGRRDITEEAVSESFARALAHRGAIRHPLPWIYKVAFRVARKELQREGRPRLPPAQTAPSDPADLQDVLGALRALPPRQRAVMVLHYQADLRVREVAHLLGISASTVRVHLLQGRRRLQELLGSEEVDGA